MRLGEHTISTIRDCADINLRETCSEVEDIPIESFKIHEGYDASTKVHDIALIRLSRNVELSRRKLHIKPICMPTKEFQRVDSVSMELQNLTVAGWGLTERNTASMSDVLMYGTIPYLPHETCVNQYENVKKRFVMVKANIHETQMCAGGAGTVDS